MTNIQAADLLKGLEQCLDDYCELNDEGKTAFHMAIAALESFGISEQLASKQDKYEYHYDHTDCGDDYSFDSEAGEYVRNCDDCPYNGIDLEDE